LNRQLAPDPDDCATPKTDDHPSTSTSTDQSLAEISKLLESFTFHDNDTQQDMSTTEKEIKALLVHEATLADDITDFLEENSVENFADSIEDIDHTIKRTEDLRSAYRKIHKELAIQLGDKYEDQYAKPHILLLETIKAYIIHIKKHRRDIKDQKNSINQTELQNEMIIRKRKNQFLVDEIIRILDYLEKIFKVELKECSDGDIKSRKRELSDHQKEIHTLSTYIKNVMESSATNSTAELNKLNSRYNQLIELKVTYAENLHLEIEQREIEKKDTFNSSILNIKLSKFRGYDSPLDIYTFQTQFEKLYLKTTPSIVLPDLLKNNHLDDPALLLVKNVDNMADIWNRLKDAYGDHKMLLTSKISELQSVDATWRIKDPERIIATLGKLTNLMKDLMELSKKHNIENKLYHSNALDMIYNLLGDNRMMRWLSISCDDPKEGSEQWEQLITFLEKEMKVNQQKLLIQGKSMKQPTSTAATKGGRTQHHYSHHASGAPFNNNYVPTKDDVVKIPPCFICGASDHAQTTGPGGMRLVQYFACKKFVDMTPQQRLAELKSKGLCFQCLFPGADYSKGKHRDGRCQRDFVCKHISHECYQSKKHVLVCDEHKDTQQNRDLLEHYKSRCILKLQQLPRFSKDIKLSFHVNSTNCFQGNESTSTQGNDIKVIYMLQTIQVDDQHYTIFYDSGCGDFISRSSAIQRIGSKAVKVRSGPIQLGGVGGITTQSQHGIYSVKLPLKNGSEAFLTGVCMDQITATFPLYPLQGKVENDIQASYTQTYGNPSKLPRLPSHVGGDVDFMVGIKYLRYFPEQIFQLPSGLTIYRSHFLNADGYSDGVIGGPHEIFRQIDKHHHFNQSFTHFVKTQHELFHLGYQVNPDVSLLGFKDQRQFDVQETYNTNGDSISIQPGTISTLQSTTPNFQQVENAGSEINFRCVKCRSCNTCKKHQKEETLSIKEEVEQELINRSVTVDVSNGITTAKLPLMDNPITRLCPNRSIALKVYYQQLKRLNKYINEKHDVIKSEAKLQSLGYVEYLKNLPENDKLSLMANQVQNFIPWRAVWKENSTSTPCRVVFDASMPTESGYSLNDILAKGRNNMNKLVEIFLRWRTHNIGFHTDVQKMYNSIKLDPSHWCFQRYLWQENLDLGEPPEEKIIMTLIYGVKSSGNQAEYGLRETARQFTNQYPIVNKVISNDVYVDDCISGSSTMKAALQLTDDIEHVLGHGDFTLKGVTMTGQDPKASLSSDGETIAVAGLKWHPKKDQLSLDVKQLNFARKYRGKKPEQIIEVPSKLTRRMCASKVGEIFDLSGMITPITATMKLDLHTLVVRKLDWDDVIPDNLRQIWISHFQTMEEISNIRFQRAIVPEDAKSPLEASTLDFGDASKSLVCITIYVRFKRKNGDYSCQLIFARSRLVDDLMSQPRAELYAALLNTHSGEVVRRSISNIHQHSIKFSDSQIVLHWIQNENLQLKQWVRNRVVEIRRFSRPSTWKYIRSEDMIADIGTRRCTSLEIVKPGTTWTDGYNWMHQDETKFPTHDVTLSQQDSQEVKKEVPKEYDVTSFYSQSNIFKGTEERYQFSTYIIDPNQRRFRTVVRITALVMIFINNLRFLRKKSTNNSTAADSRKLKSPIYQGMAKRYVILSDEDIQAAERYFFSKATLEVKKFVKPMMYKNISKEVDGILRYTGRILPSDSITITGKATNVMKDLSSTTFFVPIVDKSSPVAFSVVNDIHWHHSTASHTGIETTWRYVLQTIYIIDGRSLVKMVRSTCERCRYIMKKTIDVSMGPVSPYNLHIAPAFFITQVDLAGPFAAYSHHHKRATIKIWLVVYCCATTTAVKIKVMEDYGTTAFLNTFTRFSCDVGYPKKLLTDEGGQLLKGCESTKIDFQDIRHKLHTGTSVEFESCPVGGHNMHGRVERKIREIRKSLEKMASNERFSIMQWETISARIANNINNLPMAIRNFKGDFESMDLITPNRLLIGRNNERSPTGKFMISNDSNKIVEENQRIYDSWFENWLSSHVPKLMDQPKWYSSDVNLKQDDLVLFLKQESPLCSSYQFGIVNSVERGRDGKVRKAKVRYRNHNENVYRETNRSVRKLVVLHHVDELSIMQEIYNVARSV